MTDGTEAFEGRRAAAILGCAGPVLSGGERDFFARHRPLGFILFARNIETPDQVRALVADLRACVDDPAAPVLIDQEGGRVQRLRPPVWRAAPPMAPFGLLHGRDPIAAVEALRLDIALIASELTALGIDVDCAPVLDVPAPDGHEIIGDRAFAEDPSVVGVLGRVAMEAFLTHGVLPVAKHIPGHGRAVADSHLELPRVTASLAALEERDFPPFAALGDCPLGMTAHIVYDAIDPARPATSSAAVIGGVVRGQIGFDGVLMTDDLSMKALSGSFETRAVQAREAGCDVILHCNGDRSEMAAALDGAGMMDGEGARRWCAALARRDDPPAGFDARAAAARLDALLAGSP
ncbi:beta-N-acetylhexosaminidase [Marivibrio halodurans]|uniref:beta-N-acetylhexosaminidase n=1 Tax=Marivibrio halodurans TaxID=2039722 RepID=A0A8J7RWC4_9PROT|nr:beta-N-acetylhexosaminidase [Marivibrio halodurans]MBP5855740.1 beta-N-acetylhexosaminidase [Marivibrio halodurans]